MIDETKIMQYADGTLPEKEKEVVEKAIENNPKVKIAIEKFNSSGQISNQITRIEALNERDYGDLSGKYKDELVKIHGEKKVLEWRRSFKINPPKGESLEDVLKRIKPFLNRKILPLLKKRKK